jgi:signal transduction histidine kinase
MVRAGERLNYFPVEYVEPVRGNEKALGFDLASNPARREALEAAARLGQLSATARISLVQETGDQFGLLIFRPVFRAGVRDAKALRGYVLGVFRVGNMLGSDEGPISDGVHVALFDLDGHPGERLLYPKARSRDWDRVQDIAYDHILERGLVVGGRGWKAVAYVPAGAGTAERWLSSSALVAGLMLSILLAAYLRLSTRHRQRIEAEVAERTADLERTQSELIVAKNAAEAGSRAKSNFLATVSHELRTPMNGVIGFAELLLLPGIGEAQQQEYAGTILSSSRVLLSLLDDILDLSKIEAGKMQLMVTELEPERKLREMSAIFLESARRKGLALEAIWSGPPGARYLGDAIRVRQMLANLINNAIKFTDIGGVRVEGNELACDERGAMLEFSVMDTGIGIAPEKIELLFRPFSQIGEFEAGTTKGTGLGLSIVRKLARMMGGDAGVQSTPGKGSRFWIRIRVQMSPNTELEGPRTRSRSKLLEF